MFIFGLLNTLSYLISCLGFRGICHVSRFLSYLSFDIFRIRRSIIMQNLDIVFQESKTQKEKEHIGRKSMESFFSTMFEFFAAKHLFPKAKINLVHPEIPENLMKQGKGLYGLCIHMSNWELMCHINAVRFSPINVVVKKIGKGAVSRWVEKRRYDIGFRLIDRKSSVSPTTQIFQALSRKEIIGFIVDQKRPRGEKLPFFGKIASTNNSLVKLFLRQKAPIMPVIMKRKGYGEFDIIYFPEFVVEENCYTTFGEVVTINTARMNTLVEKMILENPEEYFWMHNRWDLKK
jgi:KDO2-lipid IV(A) lauroyltransferase